MKKIITILLIMALVISFTACAKDDDVRGTLKNEETQIDETPLSMGHAEDTVYESEFIGIGFNLPENWRFYTQDEINQMNKIAADMLDKDIAETLAKADIVYDMQAQDDVTGNSVNINLEKMNPATAATTSTNLYTATVCPDIQDALMSMGYEEVIATATTVTFVGEECDAIDVVATAENVILYEKIICKKVGSYMACITVATVNADERDNVLDMFYALD